MGHAIAGAVFGGNPDTKAALEFDVKIVPALDGFTVIALHWSYVDHWAEALSIRGKVDSRPLHNFSVVHHIVEHVADRRRFVLFDTDYFGGVGEQTAAVYKRGESVMDPTVGQRGIINRGLRLIGVPRGFFTDRFTTLGLHEHRDWDDLFSAYTGDD